MEHKLDSAPDVSATTRNRDDRELTMKPCVNGPRNDRKDT